MSSSNYRRNKAAIDQFRKELMAMVDDIREIDQRILNRAVNADPSSPARSWESSSVR